MSAGSVRAFSILLVALAVLGCSGKGQPRMKQTLPVAVKVGRLGIGCKSFAYPTSVGPPSFSVSDIGKEGVPRLTAEERRLVRDVQAYGKSEYRRFAFVGRSPKLPHGFIVFDAIHGACYSGAGGYPVLNGCTNEIYQPGDDPRYTKAGSTDIYTTPGPWMNDFPPDGSCSGS